MDLKLERIDHSMMGIFGKLLDSSDGLVAVTLEHAYLNSDGEFYAKIPVGSWKCVRGLHRLDGMLNDFETFEITGIPNRSGLLFHKGNFNADSEGCVLLGEEIMLINQERAVSKSKLAFNKFMSLQDGLDSFLLTVA